MDADEELFDRIIFCDFPKTVISSSMVREKLFLGQSVEELVPREVEKYIREKGLYNVCD